MLYVLTQAKTTSIPINNNVVVYIKEDNISGRLYNIIAEFNSTEHILGTYLNRETARTVLVNIHQGRTCQSDMWTEMPSMYENVRGKSDVTKNN